MSDCFEIKEKYTLSDVVQIVRLLRDPVFGCPWDREQTHGSIRQNFLEETYEAVEAIDRGDTELLREELGDVLLQVTLHAEMERQDGHFDIDDVADNLCRKLILRHPHIFGDTTASTSDVVLGNWEAIKRNEKKQKTGLDAILDIPHTLPSLMRSQKIQKRAAYVGFCYEDIGQALADLEDEVRELKEAVQSGDNVDGELGDVCFAAANVARFAGYDAEQCCEKAGNRFIDRFAKVETIAKSEGISLEQADQTTLKTLWKRTKQS